MLFGTYFSTFFALQDCMTVSAFACGLGKENENLVGTADKNVNSKGARNTGDLILAKFPQKLTAESLIVFSPVHCKKKNFEENLVQTVIGYSNPRTVLNPQYRKSCTTPGLHTEFLLCATLSFTTCVNRRRSTAPDDRHKSWNLKLRKEETPCAILVLERI